LIDDIGDQRIPVTTRHLTPFLSVIVTRTNTPYSYPGLFGWAKTSTLVSGALPPGISLLGASTLSGTPTQGGIFTFSLTAVGFGGDVLTCTFTLAVAAPITITLQPAYTLTMGQPASIPWVIGGGVQPFQVKVTGQPDGMYLDSLTKMALIGTPYESGTFSLLVEVSDSAYTRQQASTKITVAAPLAVGSLAASARNNNAFTASLNATGGAPPYIWRITSGSSRQV
jgi:large repetitive protein